MLKSARLLAIAPATIFLLLAFLSVCEFLLQYFPQSMFLWWINIEVFGEFRRTYRLLDLLLDHSAIIQAGALGVAFCYTLYAAKLRSLVGLFLLNHAAAILVFSSYLAYYSLIKTAGIGVLFQPRFAFFLDISMIDFISLVLGLFIVLSCLGLHWKYVERIKTTASFHIS